MFTFLADEEQRHIAVFEGMLGNIEEFKQTVGYPDQYFAYLQSYADNLIFKKDELQREIAKIKNAVDAIDFGIRRELDSILYYQEIKSFVPEKDRHLIDEVIGEERKHFIKLSQFKHDV